ncbi:MAG: DsbA family protein [Armatimonadetes bacterium]|nr:MAG: DsbA family protein [Armatimonadota bacterium]
MPGPQGFSQKQLKELKKLERLEKETEEKKQNFMKWVIISISSVIFLTLFIFIVIQTKQNANQVSINTSQNGWTQGSQNAKVTVVEFSDFECPACKAFHPLTKQLLEEYNGQIKLVFKHYPLPNHNKAFIAAEAAEAAGNQGKFWEMADILFEKQDEWVESSESAETLFTNYAKNLLIDPNKFIQDLNSKETEEKVRTNYDEGTNVGVMATPTFYVNNRRIDYLRSYDDLKRNVDQALKIGGI